MVIIMGIRQKAEFIFKFPYNLVAMFTNPFYFVRKNLYKNISKYSEYITGRTLDFGCGSKPYKDLFPKVTEYIGLDIEDQRHGFGADTVDVFYDGQTIPFDDETFDSMFSSEVYEHVPNLDRILTEMNRVLKTCGAGGGYMVVTVPFVWNEHGVPYDYKRFTSYGIKQKLEEHGFEVIDITKSTGFIQLLAQMWVEYLRGCSERIKHSVFRRIIHIAVIIPSIILGEILSLILPGNDTFYADNIVLCKKCRKVVKEGN